MEKSTQDKRVKPFIDSLEVRRRVRDFLISKKGYRADDIVENVLVEVNDIAIPIDILITIDGKNRVIVLCESPSENLSLTSRIANLIAKIMDGPPAIAVATNLDNTEIMDLSRKKTSFGLDKFPSREEAEKLVFSPDINRKDEVKKLIESLYSLKACKCGIGKSLEESLKSSEFENQ
jgi:hypothetical protein